MAVDDSIKAILFQKAACFWAWVCLQQGHHNKHQMVLTFKRQKNKKSLWLWQFAWIPPLKKQTNKHNVGYVWGSEGKKLGILLLCLCFIMSISSYSCSLYYLHSNKSDVDNKPRNASVQLVKWSMQNGKKSVFTVRRAYAPPYRHVYRFKGKCWCGRWMSRFRAYDRKRVPTGENAVSPRTALKCICNVDV